MLDTVNNFTKIGYGRFNIVEQALMYPQALHMIKLDAMTDEGTQTLRIYETLYPNNKKILKEQDSFPSKSEKWLSRARKND